MSHFVLNLDAQSVTGAIVITVAAVAAITCLSLTLLHISFTLLIPAYARRMSIPQERNFVKSPLGFYIICLFTSNFISAFGGILEVLWIGARAITEGPACTTQALALQLGNHGAALWMGVISIAALRIFMLRARSFSRMITLALISVLWTAMILFDGLASMIFTKNSKNSFYGVAGMWCWITPGNRTARLATQYAWMWFCSLVSVVCFLLVFLSVRGNITVRRDRHRTSIKWSRRAFNSYALGSGEEQYGTLVGTVGKAMCWFPIVYITLTIPISVMRVAETFGFPVPPYAFTISAVNFLLLGIANPIIYLAIRHSLEHASVDNSDTTLHGSFGGDKVGTESFCTPQEKRPSPVSKYNAFPWAQTSTTGGAVSPSSRGGGISDVTKPSSSTTYSRERSGLDVYQSNNVSSGQISVTKLPQRPWPTHRAMDSTSTVTSSGTVVGPVVQLSPVLEGESESVIKPQLTIPPAAFVARRQSTLSPNVMSPSYLYKFADVPLSPAGSSGYRRTDADVSGYSGPRTISPDLNALLQASQTSTTHIGPPPPPRKARRSPIPSVPIDVDESDQGSICSARPSVLTFSSEDTRPFSLGDMTAQESSRHVDSMRTFWAAYEAASPLSPSMPLSTDATLKRDTTRGLWATTSESSSPIQTDGPMQLGAVKTPPESLATSPSSADFQRFNRSIAPKPSLTAVGTAFMRNEMFSSRSISRKASIPAKIAEHRRSRSFTHTPTPPAAVASGAANLRPSNSATARYVGPNAQNTPSRTPADPPQSGEWSYRTPRPQPGYV